MAPDKQFAAEHNDAFYADGITIMHNQGSMILDFKLTAPRFDQADNDSQHTIITEHNAVVMQPQMAKMLLQLLEENIENYEEKFGEIEIPDRGEAGEEDADESSHGYIG